jgi:hypothetical protein
MPSSIRPFKPLQRTDQIGDCGKTLESFTKAFEHDFNGQPSLKPHVISSFNVSCVRAVHCGSPMPFWIV